MKKCNNCEKSIADYYMNCPYCGTKTGVEFADLVVMLQSGDVNALEEIMKNTENQLLFLARSYTKDDNDAKDVVQNAYIKAYNNIQSCIPERFLGWIRTIVSREALTFMDKANERYNVHFTDLETSDGEGNVKSFDIVDETVDANPEMKFEQSEKERMLFEILDSLPDKQRVVIMKSYYEDMKIKDIAQELSINENTVKTLIRRAKESIKEAVENLERRDGIKLYNFTPFTFFLWLLRGVDDARKTAFVLSIPVSAVTGAAATSTTAVAATAATSTVSAVASGAGTAITSSVAAKVAVGAVVALTAIGGGVAVSNINKPEETVHEHNYVESSKMEATCEKEGTVVYLCKECNDTYSVVIEKLKECEVTEENVEEEKVEQKETVETHNCEDNRDEWITVSYIEATCDKAGYSSKKCNICGKVYETEIPKLEGGSCVVETHDCLAEGNANGHYIIETLVTPLCNAPGKHLCVCNVCGKQYVWDIGIVPGNHAGDFELVSEKEVDDGNGDVHTECIYICKGCGQQVNYGCGMHVTY